MRRLRREVPVAQGAVSRLAVALALSAAVHAGLLAVVVPHSPPGRPADSMILHARLADAPLEGPPVRAAATHAFEPVPVARLATDDLPVAEPPAIAPAEASVIEAAPPPPVAIAAIPDTTYYSAQDLDVYPRPIETVRADYPPEARANRVSGHVSLLVSIDEAGRVTEISVMDAQPGSVFDETARMAFVGAAFTPAEREGKPARSRILIKVEFDPDKP